MNARELEKKYLDRILNSGGLMLLPVSAVLELLDDLATANARFLGVEAFRVFDEGGVQPGMEFSNTSFGQIDEIDGKLQVTSLRRDLMPEWKNEPDVLSRSKEMVLKGQADEYDWYEVSIEDPDTDDLLFFRAFE